VLVTQIRLVDKVQKQRPIVLRVKLPDASIRGGPRIDRGVDDRVGDSGRG